jgi:hypothetical protein
LAIWASSQIPSPIIEHNLQIVLVKFWNDKHEFELPKEKLEYLKNIPARYVP